MDKLVKRPLQVEFRLQLCEPIWAHDNYTQKFVGEPLSVLTEYSGEPVSVMYIDGLEVSVYASYNPVTQELTCRARGLGIKPWECKFEQFDLANETNIMVQANVERDEVIAHTLKREKKQNIFTKLFPKAFV